MEQAAPFLMSLDEFNCMAEAIKNFFKKDSKFKRDALKAAVLNIAKSYISI